jgi:hypothetical protein
MVVFFPLSLVSRKRRARAGKTATNSLLHNDPARVSAHKAIAKGRHNRSSQKASAEGHRSLAETSRLAV